jgi:arylsulfatase
VHVTDLAPTVLDLIGLPFPRTFAGMRTRVPDGASFRSVLERPAAAETRTTQHYELAGNRGYIANGWKIVSLQPPGKPIDLDNWMLFDLRSDPTETRDLASIERDRLRALVDAFDADASANDVYPLDNRGVRRSLTVPPYLEASVNMPRTFHAGTGTVALAVVAPMIADRNYVLTCEFGYTPGDRGVVFALGDPIAGMALYARDGTLSFFYHGGQGKVAECALPAREGRLRFALHHRALGARRGVGEIRLNDAAVATLDLSPTTILGLGVGEGLDLGCDRRLHVTARYGECGACTYTGVVHCVHIEPGSQAPDSYANRPERLAQRD